MRNARKRTINNLINALLAGSILFGCSCTLCNKRYYVNFILPKTEAASTDKKAIEAQIQTANAQGFLEK